MNKNKMKGVRAMLHELVVVRQRTKISIYASGRNMIAISGARYLTAMRGKHRGLPGRGMGVSRHLVDDLNFEVFSVPDTVLSYGSKHFSKELIDDLSAVRPQLVGLYKEQINDNGAMLSKDFFKPETHVHELGLRCMEVAGMLPRGGLAASKEDFDAFFENKPVEMLNDPANNGW